MNRIYTATFCLLFFVVAAHAQNIGIGTAQPDASAALDISSANKGLLIPRMDLAIAAPAAPANGLLVFNTNTAYGRGAGIYINMGTGVVPRWMQLQPDSSGAFIQNRQTPQANTDFNISGSGAIGQSLKVGGLLDVNGAIKASGDISTSGNFILDVKWPKKEFNVRPYSWFNAGITCPSGYRLIGGGGGLNEDISGFIKSIHITYNGPNPRNTNAWKMYLFNGSASIRPMIIYCQCAKVR